MKLINFGSLNIDKVYTVPHTVKEGETIFAENYSVFTGGKGLNQSVAASKAGMKVLQAGALGPDGDFLRKYLESSGVDVSMILNSETQTGNALIQVNKEGQNSIVVYGGANRQLTEEYIDSILDRADSNDMVLLQNETNKVDYIINKAHEKGLFTAWNPSPFTDEIKKINCSYVDVFFVNEIEGALLADTSSEDCDEILSILGEKFPKAVIVLTLGEKGVFCIKNGFVFKKPAFKVKAVDTTAAGDTFTGYFLFCLSKGMDIDSCLEYASAASALAVSKQGAAPSIPALKDVENFLKH